MIKVFDRSEILSPTFFGYKSYTIHHFNRDTAEINKSPLGWDDKNIDKLLTFIFNKFVKMW